MRFEVRRWAATIAALAVCAPALAADITGAGATFPYPVYAKWAQAYKAASGVAVNYQSIGSGGGIKQIQAETVDFGASDAPLEPEVLKKGGLIQFPTVMGGVVPVVNLPGIEADGLKLDGETLAGIYLGRIKKWNDPKIVALNPGVKLPSRAITVVHRSDGSGTTFVFTHYLCQVSQAWKDEVGNSTAVQWPAPTSTGGKGNEGVASFVQRIKGSIGYVEYAFAHVERLARVRLKNRAGNFVAPTAESFAAAAAGAAWKQANGFHEILTNEPGPGSWPIASATFILMHKQQVNPARANAVLDFFDWAYREGDRMAVALDYVPLPDSVVALVRRQWQTSITGPDGNPIRK